MAQLLADKVKNLSGIEICGAVESNGVFARMPKELIEPLQKEYFFYVWDAIKSEVRWMTSWDTTEEDINGFAKTLEALLR